MTFGKISPVKNSRKFSVLFATFFMFLFCTGLSGNLFAADKPLRTKVFRLNYIQAKDAKIQLEELNFCETINIVPGVNALVVNSNADNLIRAKSLIDLVDSERRVIVDRIVPASKGGETYDFTKEIKYLSSQNIQVGTFLDPPESQSGAMIILDRVGQDVVVVMPEIFKDMVEKAFQSADKCEVMEEKAVEAKSDVEESVAQEQVKVQLEADNQTPTAGTESVENDEPAKESQEPKEDKERDFAKEMMDMVKSLDPNIAEAMEKQSPEPTPQSLAVKEKTPGLQTTPVIVKEEAKTVDAKVEERKAVENSYRKYTENLDIPNAEQELELTITLPEKVEITALLELVGKQLGLNYIYDPAKVKGDVMLKVHDGKIKLKDTYALLESVLSFRDFVMTRRGNLVTIVPKAEVSKLDPTLQAVGEKVKPGDVVITSVFALDHISTDAAKKVLDTMQLTEKIIDVPETGTLIITGYTYKMDRIEKILSLVDVPGEKREFKSRPLQYTEAATLIEKVKTLSEQLGTVDISVGADQKATPAAVKRDSRGRVISAKPTAAQGATIGEKTEGGVFLDYDERTNRILMIGTEAELAIVNNLIDNFDVPKKDLRFVKQYQLEYVDAEDVQGKLQELGIISGSRSTTSTRKTTNARNNVPKTTQPTTASISAESVLGEEPQVIVIESSNSLLVNALPEQHEQIVQIIAYIDSKPKEDAIPVKLYSLENQDPEAMAETLEKLISEIVEDKEGKIEKKVKKEDDITIVPDKATFSIIVFASKKNQEWIGRLIHDLDRRRPQVLLDATLVAITKNDSFNYDLQLATKLPDMEVDGAMDVVGSIVEPFVGTSKEGYSRPINGTAQAFYSGRRIQALLTAMQTKDYGRVLAQPRILVNDNEEGVITTKNTTYIARRSTTTQGETTPVVSENVTFDEFESGIDLTIKPTISEGDLLRLEINLKRSSQGSAATLSENQPPPDKTENEISTIVTVPNDSTIILGGINQLDQKKGGNKVPLLGDLPLIGGLFRSIGNVDNQAKLYIFVKANIMRSDDNGTRLPELESLSDRKRKAFEKEEKDWQQYEDWPGVKSQPVDPVRVLDVE